MITFLVRKTTNFSAVYKIEADDFQNAVEAVKAGAGEVTDTGYKSEEVFSNAKESLINQQRPNRPPPSRLPISSKPAQQPPQVKQ